MWLATGRDVIMIHWLKLFGDVWHYRVLSPCSSEAGRLCLCGRRWRVTSWPIRSSWVRCFLWRVCASPVRRRGTHRRGSTGHQGRAGRRIWNRWSTLDGTRGAGGRCRRTPASRIRWQGWSGRTPNTLPYCRKACNKQNNNYCNIWRIKLLTIHQDSSYYRVIIYNLPIYR